MMNVFIFLAGLAVYAGYGLPGLGYLVAATLLSYVTALLTPRLRPMMWVSVAANALMLVLLKLQPVTGMELISAMGVSYFSLQLISYNVDVWKEKYPPERNLYRFALYVTYLPHLFIGPIERYDRFAPAMQNRRMTVDAFFHGGARALWGLTKKLVIASRLGVIIGAISAKPDSFNGAYALVAMLLYSFQLYSDFSGGMDMVLGISQMLGMPLSENFDTPYFSRSFQEFWRRWHITLGSWLREYVYIPLGGNRKGTLRKYLNTVITFLVSGLWHGVQYLLWGLFNGIFVCFGTRLQTKWKTLDRIGTFLLISLLWSFFIWPDALTALKMVGSVFTTFNYGAFFTTAGTLGLTVADWIILGAALLLLWGYDLWHKALRQWFDRRHVAVRTAVICALALLVMLFGMYGIGFNAQAFIYSQF
ncbi:MAG: MBOAT family protein [Oscillospiraceae bacterium]|nr:MBOAT family protein [Oscillospiraceae bacterium]